MTKSKTMCKKVVGAFVTLLILFVASCNGNVGLGESVDTEAPKLEITYPPVNAVIRDSFILAGTSSDDKGVTSLKVIVNRVENAVSTPICDPQSATIEKDGSWHIELNDYDAENAAYYNGWQYADGSYEITATAYDNTGRSTTTSRIFSIDNTAPVLVLTTPTTVGTQSAKSYGQQVQLQGSFSEMSENIISMLTITYYAADGTVKHQSSFSNISDMSSANPLTIAQYYKPSAREALGGEDREKWEGYKALYSAWQDFDEGTLSESEQSYFTVTAYDVAKIYKTVGDSGEGSGNATSTYYRGTTEMLHLIEKKNSAFPSFSVLALRNYLNGTDTTYSADSSTQDALEALLSAAKSVSLTNDDAAPSSEELTNTSTASGNVFLTFQVNPNNNPKFTASGFAINAEKADGQTYSDATSGAAGYKVYYAGADIQLKVAAGLDNTKLDTSTVSVYAVPYSVKESDLEAGYAANKVLLWTWNEAVAVSYKAKKALSDATSDEYKEALADVLADTEKYRYTVTASEENSEELSQGTSLSETEVALSKPYYIIAEGADIDGQKIVNASDAGYGIWPTTTAAAPELTIGELNAETNTNLADDTVLNQSGFERGLTYSGLVDCDNVILTNLIYTVTLTSASDETKTASITGDLTASALDNLKTELPYTYEWSFTVTPNAAMTELLETAGRYKLSINVVAKSNAAPNGVKEIRSLIIDNKSPTVSNLSLSNTVSGKLGEATVYYVNPETAVGGYTLTGNSIDNYVLSSTTWTVSGVDEEGAVKTLTDTIENTSEWTAALDLTGFAAQADVADIAISITAADSALNTSAPATLLVELDTAAPEITFVAGEEDPAVWNNSAALTISGTALDSGSGATYVYYKLNDSSILKTLAVNNGSFSGSATFTEGQNTVHYYAEDALGNRSAEQTRTVRVDTTAPTYTGTAPTVITNATSAVTFNALTFSDAASDTSIVTSGLNVNAASVVVKIGSAAPGSGDTAALADDGMLTVTVSTDTLGALSGYVPVTATVSDNAGNSTTATLGTLNVDRTAPTVSIGASSTYFVKDSVEDIAVTVSDANGLATNAAGAEIISYALYAAGDITVTNGAVTVASGAASLSAGTAAVSGSTATISGISTADSALFADGAQFRIVITAEDVAGNVATRASSIYTVDKTAPAIATDSIGGTAWSGSASTVWQKATALGVEGTITESGSGVKAVYYQVAASDDTTATAMTGGADGNYADASVRTGIIYTTKTAAGAITFSGTVDSFVVGANTLRYVLEDNAGNVSAVAERTVSVDTVAPAIEEVTSGSFQHTTTANSAAGLTFTFKVSDANSGINTAASGSTTATITIGDDTISQSNATYGTLNFTETDNGYTGTVTLKASLGEKLTDGNLYTVYAAVYDNAGNYMSKQIGILSLDMTAPTVTITDATSNYAKDSLSVSVAATDTNGIYRTVSGVQTADVISYAVYAASDVTVASSGVTIASGATALSSDTAALSGGLATITLDTSDTTAYADGTSFILCVTAADQAGNETTAASKAYTIDKTAPSVTFTVGDSTATWNNSTSLAINGTASDTGSGAKTVYYKIGDAASWTELAVSGTAASGTFNGSATFASGETTVTYKAVDAVGNESTPATKTVRVDTVAPTYTGSAQTVLTNATSAVTFNAITFSDAASDASTATSGLNTASVSVSLGSASLGSGDTATFAENGVLTVTVSTATLSTLSGYVPVTATVTDNAGNSTTATIGTLNVDLTPPTVSIAAASTYFVKNSVADITVTVSDATGLATNTDGAEVISWGTYAVTDTSYETALSTGTATVSGSSATISGIDTSGNDYADGAQFRVVVRATDGAGNTTTRASSAYTIDKTAPSVTFTVGDSTATWNNSTSLAINGTTADTGSGAKTVYYKIGDAASWTELAVSGTAASGTFNGSATFASGETTVTYKAVDAVGNESTPATKTVRVDTVAPVVTETTDTDATVITSFEAVTVVSTATTAKTIKALITDAESGINEDTLSVVLASGSDTHTVSSVVPEAYTGDTATGYSVKATIPSTLVAALADGKQYTVTLTGQDNAGNSVSQFIGYVKVDSSAPTVTINGSAAYVNSTQSLTVQLTDASTIASLAWKTCAYTEGATDYSAAAAVQSGTVENPGYTAAITIDFGAAAYTDGTAYVLCVQATDSAGNVSSYAANSTQTHVPYSAAYTVDKTAPALNAGSTIGGASATALSSQWLRSATLALTGSWTDTGSGVETMYYLVDGTANTVSASNYTGMAKLTAGTDGVSTYSATITLDDGAAHTIQYLAVDALGNASAPQTFTFKVDATAPTASASSDTPLAGGTVSSATLTGIELSDATSGIASVTWAANGHTSADETNYFTVAAPTDATNGSYSVTVASGAFASVTNNAVTVTVTVTDNAGNSTTAVAGTINVDNIAPTLTVGATSTYYVKDSVEAIAVTVSDANGLATSGDDEVISYAVYAAGEVSVASNGAVTITDGATPLLASANAAVSGSTATIPAINTSDAAFADGGLFRVVVTAQDSVGNTTTRASNVYTVDKTAPAIASDSIGGTAWSSSASTVWQKATALGVEGTITESGSGVKAVYYQLVAAGDTTTEAMTGGADGNYADAKTGVIYTTKTSSGTITFTSTVDGFAAGSNTLRYVLVDNAGNVSAVAERTVSVDTVAPTISEVTTGTFSSTTSGRTAAGVTFSFHVFDANSGIVTAATGSTTATITIGDLTISQNTDTYGTLALTSASYALNGNTVDGYTGTLTLAASLNSVLTDGNLYPVYATVYDAAGNYTTATIGILTLDMTPPTVTITNATLRYVQDSLSLSVAATDTNGIWKTVGGVATENVISYAVYASTDTSYQTALVSDTAALTGGVGTLTIDTSLGSTYADGDTFIVRITALDKAGNETTANSAVYTIDKTPPTVTFTAGSSSATWNNSTSLAINGTASDTGSGAKTVYYKIGDATEWTELAVSGSSFNGSATFASSETTVTYKAVDAVGNESSAQTTTVRVDVAKPVLTATNNATHAISTHTAAIPLTFTAAEASATESGIDVSTLSVKIGDNVISLDDDLTPTESSGTFTYTTTLGTVSYTTSTTDGLTTYSFTVTPSATALLADTNTNALASGSTYNVQASISDQAGNVSDTKTIQTFTVDTTAPTVKVEAVTGTNRFVKNTKTITVQLSDSNAVASAEWAVFAYNASDAAADGTVTYAVGNALNSSELTSLSGFTAGATASTATFDISVPGGVSNGGTFVVCVRAKDAADNESTYSGIPGAGNAVSSIYTVDTVAPTLSGVTIGGTTPATSAETATAWLSDETLTVSAATADTGSGIAAVYYQLIAAGTSNATAMTGGASGNYATTGTKVALSAGTDGSAAFEANVRGFVASSSANAVRLVGVDAVGNATDVATYYIWRDNEKPEITGTSDATQTGKSGDTFTFTCNVTDGASGINTNRFSVAIGNVTISASETTYGTISYDATTHVVTITTTAALTTAPEGGSAPLEDGKLYSVNLTAYDNAGNSEQKTVKYLKTDNTPPTVKVAQVSGNDVYVKGTKTITASITDTGSISAVNYAVFAYEANRTDYSEQTAIASGTVAEPGSSVTFTVDFSATNSDSSYKYADATGYVVCVKATDEAGNESAYTRGTADGDGVYTHNPISAAYFVDRSAPTLATGDRLGTSIGSSGSTTWVNASTLSISGTWNDAGVGASMLYYQLNSKDSAGATVAALTSENYATVCTGSVALSGTLAAGYPYNTNVAGFVTGSNTLLYVAVDSLGNVSNVVTRTVSIDTTAPTVTTTSTINETVGNASAQTISGLTVSDAQSGIDITNQHPFVKIGSYTITHGADYTDDIRAGSSLVFTQTESSNGTATAGTFTLTLSTSLLGSLADSSTNAISATVYDMAGNYGTTTLGTLTMDLTAPVVTITQVSGTAAYVNGTKEVVANIREANTITQIDWAVFAKATDATTYNDARPIASGSLTGTAANTTNPTITVDFSKPASGTALYTDGSEYVVCIKATDAADNVSSYSAGVSSVYKVDYTAPSFGHTSGTATAIGGKTTLTNAWFMETALSVVGSWTEAGSGIDKVYYQVIPAGSTGVTAMTNTNYADDGIASGSFSTTPQTGYENFSTSISGFTAASDNQLILVAVDNVGNASATKTFTINIDSTAPTLAAATSGSSDDTYNYALNGTSTTGGTSPSALPLYFTVSDATGESGVDSIALTINGTTITLSDIQATVASADTAMFTSSATATSGSTIEYTKASGLVTVSLSSAWLSSLDTGYYPVSAVVTDLSGRSATGSVRTLSVDKSGPTVRITSPISGSVNKTILVEGTAFDTAGLPSDATGWSVWATATEDAAQTASGSVAATDITVDAVAGTWTAKLDTTALYNNTATETIYIYALATDSLGNVTVDDSKASASVVVNQNADRPTVKVTNLTKQTDGSYVLLYGTDAQISGTVSDDDATSTAAVAAFVASSTSLTALPANGTGGWTVTENAVAGTITYAHATNGTTVFTKASGDWTYTPANTADGSKDVYFFVQDNSTNGVQTAFYTGATSALTQPYFQYKSETATASSAKLTYQSNKGAPDISSVSATAYKAATGTDNNVTYAEADVYQKDGTDVPVTRQLTTTEARLIVGGTDRTHIKLTVTSTDNNGISAMTLDFADADVKISTDTREGFTSEPDGFTPTTDSTAATWAPDIYIPMTSLTTGTHTITVYAYDTSGLYSSKEYMLAIDNSGPGISITTTSDTQSGAVSFRGSTEDVGTAGTKSTKWLIPTTTNQASTVTDAELYALADSDGNSLWNDSLVDGYNATSWAFSIAKSDMASYTTTTYGTQRTDGKWTLPMYVLAEDNLGKYTIDRTYTLTYDPNADRPQTTIGDPMATGNATSGNIRGGKITVLGTATIPSLATTVDAIYVQIATANVTYTTNAETNVKEISSVTWSGTNGTAPAFTTSGTIDDKSKMSDYGFNTVYTAATAKPTGVTDLAFATGVSADDWWGIKATKSSSAWYISLNENGEMNPAEGEVNKIAVRACAINANGEVGDWTDIYYIDVDSTAPVQMATLRQFTNAAGAAVTITGGETGNADSYVESSAASALQAVTSQMYVKGDWYLTVKLTDESALDGYNVYVKAASAESYTATTNFVASSKVWTYSDQSTSTGNTATAGKVVESVTRTLFIPLDTSGASVAYKVEVTDSSEAGGHTITAEYDFNIDNTPPTISAVYKGSSYNEDNLLSASDDNAFTDSNYIYTLGGTVDESGAGFERLAFYFVRATDIDSEEYSSEVVLDPLITTNTTAAKALINDLTKRTYTQNSTSYYMYAAEVAGTIEEFTFTPTTAANITDNAHIRAGGLMDINGTLRKIGSIDDSTGVVTFTKSTGYTSATSVTVYFPYAQVVDNTSTEKTASTSANPFTFESDSDDGDKMPETLTGSKAVGFTWDATIHSSNMPDGPCTLVVLAFDAAGNVSGRTYPVTVQNSAPRLAKVWLGTDLNSDGSWTSGEFEQYNLYESNTAHGLTTSGVRDALSITTANWGSQFTVKDKLAVVAEIVGGNGGISMVYKKGAPDTTAVPVSGSGAGTSATADTATTGITSKVTGRLGSVTYNNATTTTSLKGYTLTSLQVADLTQLGDGANADSVSASFTFWDSTDETTAGVTSQRCVLRVTDLALALYDDVAPEAKIYPFYWKDSDHNSLYGDSTSNGHIELTEDLPELFSGTGGGEYDTDPKVSGKIVVKGKAYDAKMLSDLQLRMANFDFGEGLNTFKTVATYDTTSGWSATETDPYGTLSTDGYSFYVGTNTLDQSGHTVEWELTLDTSFVKSATARCFAATDCALVVQAHDASIITTGTGTSTVTGNYSDITSTTNTAGTAPTADTVLTEDDEAWTCYYRMDVVPYITGISTSNRTKSGLKDANIRSASGKYSIMYAASTSATSYAADFITVTGFNLNPSAVRVVNSTTAATSDVEATSGTQVPAITSHSETVDGAATTVTTAGQGYTKFWASNVIAKSGYFEVFTNGVRSLNNVNNNDSYGSATNTSGATLTSSNATVTDYASAYNREPDYYETKNVQLTDDRYLLLWDMKDTGVKNGYYPVMAMNDNNPVFGYVDNSGGVNSAAGTASGTGAGTYRYSNAQAQRAEFNASTGAEVYTEYLVKQLNTNQMGMAMDEGGRFLQATVYDYDGAGMALYYDRYNEIQSSNYGYGWGPGTGYSGYNGNYAYETGNNAIVLETCSYSDGTYTSGRYQNPKLIMKGNSKTGTSYVYMSYFDAATNEILFRNFQLGTSVTGTSYNLASSGSDSTSITYAQKINFSENSQQSGAWNYYQNGNQYARYNNDTYSTGRLNLVSDGSNYFAMGVTDDYHVVVVYLNNVDNKLVLKYSTDPVTGSAPTSAVSWTTSTVDFPENVGSYVSLALDGNSVHIAAFDSYDSNLVYLYLPTYSDDNDSLTSITVDQASAVGNWTQIKVKDGIPYIAYYNSTETGGRDSIKLAYPTNASNKTSAGVDVQPGTSYNATGTSSATGYTTGYWEYMTVPAIKPPQGGDPKFQQVCLDFDLSGTPVVGYLGTNLEFGKWLTEE